MRLVLSFVAIAFGAMTIKSGGFALFGGEAGKEFSGNYVGFVLWFNFLAGFIYIVAGLGIFLKKSWCLKLSYILAAITAVVFAAFGVAILTGVSYEMRTVGAMTFRVIFWIIISILVKRFQLSHVQPMSGKPIE